MTPLDTALRALVHAHIERTELSGRRFGAEALNDPGFVASLAKGRRLGLKTADRVLAFIGDAPIGPAFRREVEAFLRLTGTKVYVLGEAAAKDASFVERLRRGASLRLETVDGVRAWMGRHAGADARAGMRRAVAGTLLAGAPPGPPGPAGGETASGAIGSQRKGETGMKQHDESNYLSTRRAAAFLGLSPRTLDRYRVSGAGPAFHRFGNRILYRRDDLEAWASARRVASTSEADTRASTGARSGAGAEARPV